MDDGDSGHKCATGLTSPTENNRCSTATISLHKRAVPANTVSSGEEIGCNSTFEMGRRKVASPTKGNQPSANAASLSGYADSNHSGYNMDNGNASIGSQTSPADATFGSRGSRGSSTETATNICPIVSPNSTTETAASSAPNCGHPTVTTQSTSSHLWLPNYAYPKAPFDGIPGDSAGLSSIPSQSLEPRVPSSFNTSRPSKQHASSVDNHSLSRRSSTILGELESSAQQAADVVRHQCPPVQGAQVIPATAVCSSRKSNARVSSGDIGKSNGSRSGNITETEGQEWPYSN